jgi:predicted dehydrogenase
MNGAIVGCGSIAEIHGKVIKEIEGCNLVAVADPVLERAKLISSEYGALACHIYESLEEMLEKEKIDVLHICTPHYLHVPMAIYALDQGVNVFMEKPPAISKEQFQLLKESQKTGKLGICFQNRYNETVKAVNKMLREEAGSIKGARAIVTWNRTKDYYTESSWRGSLKTEGGGALINQAIHTLDLLTQFLGRPLMVEATCRNHHLKNIVEVEDTVEAYIQFQNSTAVFYATTACNYNAPIFLELECENMVIRLEDGDVVCIKDGHKETLAYYKGETVGKDYWGTGHNYCIKDYYKCLQNNEEFQVGLSSVEDTFNLMMGIYESSDKNEMIIL